MTFSPALLWQQPLPASTESRLRDVFSTIGDTPVFFRADDIGRADDRVFPDLLELFASYRIPLCPAVVPAWISRKSWASYKEFQPNSTLWCWHQHGYAHINHEPRGKKAEFGTSRPAEIVYKELSKGMEILIEVTGGACAPIFTPPWNRCSETTLGSLQQLDFKAVSRSKGAMPPPLEGLPDLAVNVDLHTRKEQNGEASWQNLFDEMTIAAQTGVMGIMLHHLLMNRQSFLFLDMLLRIMREYRTNCLTFKELIT